MPSFITPWHLARNGVHDTQSVNGRVTCNDAAISLLEASVEYSIREKRFTAREGVLKDNEFMGMGETASRIRKYLSLREDGKSELTRNLFMEQATFTTSHCGLKLASLISFKTVTHRSSKASVPVLGVGDKIGEGDTYLVETVLPPELAEVVFEKLMKEVAWNDCGTSCIVESSSSTSHCPESASLSAPTEVANDINHIEQSPGERIETFRAAGIKARDFAYEPMPNSSKAPEVFDPVPCLITANWHMCNPDKNHVVSQNESMPTPSQRVRLRRQAGLATYPDDYQDKVFFGYNPTGYSDDNEGEAEADGGPPPRRATRAPTPPVLVLAEMASASTSTVVKAEAEAAEVVVVEEEPKPKRRKVNGTTKTRSRAKLKPLRRECSRPERLSNSPYSSPPLSLQELFGNYLLLQMDGSLYWHTSYMPPQA
ncbi:hypothetical protein F5888DRAFT_1889369 [Russula emetica]|nr:hypothetical protein F5888DRAFT_1889369 [Russula emetica]